MRVFVASVLSEANQATLAAAVRDLVAGTHPVLRAIPADTAHLTFSFIARAEELDVARVTDALRQVSADWNPVTIELTGARVLGARRAPRLVYAPVSEGHQAIERMAAEIHRALEAAVPSLEPSLTKSPHVTLARFRKNARPTDAAIVERALATSPLASIRLRDAVSSLQLIQSALTQTGPVYQEIETVTIGETSLMPAWMRRSGIGN
jgi:2'-5' RNA ligase